MAVAIGACPTRTASIRRTVRPFETAGGAGNFSGFVEKKTYPDRLAVVAVKIEHDSLAVRHHVIDDKSLRQSFIEPVAPVFFHARPPAKDFAGARTIDRGVVVIQFEQILQPAAFAGV